MMPSVRGAMVIEAETAQRQLRERRNLVSLFMVTALLSLALQETITPVRSLVRSEGLTLASSALFVVFFLTLFRFFVGNVLHLQSPELTNRTSGFRWVFDLLVIVVECVIMIFIAGVATLRDNAESRFGFFDLMVGLFTLDIAWVMAMFTLAAISRLPLPSRLKHALARETVPYRWAILNTVLSLYIIGSGFLDEGHVFSNIELWVLVVVNVVAFILDVLVFDYEGLV
jgi:hypothetical protein